MERKSIEDGFEDFLREKTDQFRMHPSESVWTELAGRMHKPRRWPYALGGVLLFGLGIGAGILLERLGENLTSSNEIKVATHNGKHEVLSALPSRAFASPTDQISEESRIVESFLLNENFQQEIRRKQYVMAAPEKTAEWAVVSQFTRTTDVFPTNGRPIDVKIEPSVFEPGKIRTMALARQTNRSLKTDKDRALKPSTLTTVTANVLNSIGKMSKRTGLQLYVAPSVSYRRLVGQATKSNFTYSGFPYSANYGFPTDVNDAVIHKPAFGLEIGSSLTQNIGPKIRLKAGLQFNFNNYDIEAYSYMPELAPFSAARTPGIGSAINTVAYYRNANGFDRTWLRNSHVMVSVPVGFEASLFGNRRVRFNVASTIQPTYVLNNKSYLISTNLKNYAQEPALYRNWNINAGAEAYLSVDAGTHRWVIGPQMRYQLLSSYKEDYPIREHLVDYGFKIGIQKTLK